jgi:hypothetical protein
MGFQGDVAGIGLGELLQGLARGGREGVLTLRGGSTGATVGLQGGQLYLLPEPDEDPEIWRRRCEKAWVKDPNERIDILRMSEIAYAARLEEMFLLLDSQGVHFRFEPGPLPDAASPAEEPEEFDDGDLPLDRIETGARKVEVNVPVHCPGISVEFLLLEHARLADECQTAGDAHVPVHTVARLLTNDAPTPGLERFWEECDGMSNLIEIADRLGWPIRQCSATVQQLWSGGHVRLADARELLVLSQKELAQNRFPRAASRLSGWVLMSPAGPPPVGDAHLLIAEWQKGKLPAMVASMEAREARTLLRRLEHVEGDVDASIERWKKLREFHKHDPIAEVRLIKWQLTCEDEAEAPAMADLLRIARKFQDLGHNLRAAVLLRGAAAQMPENTSVRLEVGLRMLAVDLIEEGCPWVIEACSTLIESGLSEKAVGPLRTLLTADPGNRDARALIGAARTNSASGKRYRRNSIVALAVLLMLSLVALVKVQFDQDRVRRLEEVADYLDQPERALEMLTERFGDDRSEKVQDLRDSIYQQLLTSENEQRETWLALFETAQLECTGGDPLLGLQLALELPPAPVLVHTPTPEWPTAEELLDDLAGRLEQTVAEWGPPVQDRPEQLHVEERLSSLVFDIRTMASEADVSRELDNFGTRIDLLADMLQTRAEHRAEDRQRMLEQQTLERQNMLLAAARGHAEAGDLERSVQSFRELVTMEGSEALAKVLAAEVTAVEAHYAAVIEARRLSLDGRHDEARRTLQGPCPNPSEHLLPWRVETWPSGGRVTLPDGSMRVAPFVVQSAFGEHVDLWVKLDGHEPLQYAVDDPRDLLLHLSRLPDRWWATESPVEALPVAVEDDHICADRGGNVVRLSENAGQLWQASLETLGGVARTPVFLPRRQGFVLAVSEDGGAWLIGAADGAVEGPWSYARPPISGPSPIATGAEVTFVDGKTATWHEGLEPEIESARTVADNASNLGFDSGLAVLRRRAEQGTELESPWSPYVVTVHDEHYAVHWEGRDEASFTVRRTGDWQYLAWEAPNASIPGGRLWISDGAGLRAFHP